MTDSSVRATADQQLVAGVVAEAVVDVLEAVEIEERPRRPTSVRWQRAMACVRRSRNSRRFGSPRERVVHRLVREPLLERLALDRDRRELREQHEDLPVLVVGEARLGARRRRACPSTAPPSLARIGTDHAARNPCASSDVAMIGPPVVGRDVGTYTGSRRNAAAPARTDPDATGCAVERLRGRAAARVGATRATSQRHGPVASSSTSMIAHEKRGN